MVQYDIVLLISSMSQYTVISILVSSIGKLNNGVPILQGVELTRIRREGQKGKGIV